MKVVLLASGAGSLASAIFSAIDSGDLAIDIALVISDKDAPVLATAQSRNIATALIPMKPVRADWDREIFAAVAAIDPDLVVSVGFMRILAADFVARFKTINTHPALLPLFPGAHAVEDALAAGASVTGTTVHWVDAGMDTGEVISQREVAIQAGDSAASLHERIKIQERLLIVETLQKFASNGIPGSDG
jgi:phosphoribosylglycinamide formyltransferase-1